MILFSTNSDKHLLTQPHHCECSSASLRTPYYRHEALTCFCAVQASHKWQKAGKCSYQPGWFTCHTWLSAFPPLCEVGSWGIICSQLPMIHHWQAVAVPCLQMSQGQEGDFGGQGEEVVKQSRVMIALKHSGFRLPAKGIVFHPAWRKEGNWRWRVLCSLSIPQQTMARVSCPAVGSSCPTSMTQRPSVRGTTFSQVLKSFLPVTGLWNRKGKCPVAFVSLDRTLGWCCGCSAKGCLGKDQVTGR